MKLVIKIFLILTCFSSFSQGVFIKGNTDIEIESGAFMVIANGGNFEIDNQNTDFTIPDVLGTLKISGDWINNTGNTVDLSSSAGVVIFNGLESQQISGDALSIFNNVTLENDLALGINNDINGTLDLSSGSLSLNALNLKIYENAEITNYSSSYNIITNGIGELKQYLASGNAYKIFPVSTTTSYTPLYIKQNSGTSGFFNARLIDGVWSEGTSGTNLALTEPVVNRTWIIDADVTPDANVKLQWNASDEVNGFDRQASLAANYSGQWNIVSTTISGDGPYLAEFTDVSSFDANQPHTLSDDNDPLPVELISFEVSKIGENNLIKWQTASELNCAKFNLYSSSDYRNYNLVGSVSGNINSNIVLNYSFIDENTYNSEYVYYKLEQIDVNGHKDIIAESFIKNGLIDEISSARIYSNQLVFESNVNLYNTQIEIYSTNSKLIYSNKVTILKGTNKIDVNIPDLSSGVYLVLFKFLNNNKKLIKVNSLQTP